MVKLSSLAWSLYSYKVIRANVYAAWLRHFLLALRRRQPSCVAQNDPTLETASLLIASGNDWGYSLARPRHMSLHSTITVGCTMLRGH